MTGFIAVHCGAGHHKFSLRKRYKKSCKKACLAAGKILEAGGTSLDACQCALMVLEEDEIMNAGFGSNLTISGDVECDASIMDGKSLNFGACGAVKSIKYPITLATQICKDQSVERPYGLIPPSLLVGQGAYEYALKSSVITVNNKTLISKKSLRRYKRYKTLLNSTLHVRRLDTVGAVCVDSHGHVAAASSSGGIFMKHNGRIGQAATFASGVWADSMNNKDENSIATTTTGCGEYLVKTVLARELAKNVKNSSCPVTAFHKTLKEDFLDSNCLRHVTLKLAGALTLKVTPSGYGELIWGHSSRSMGLAYLDLTKKKLKGVISELPDDKDEGKNIVVSGVNFNINVS